MLCLRWFRAQTTPVFRLRQLSKLIYGVLSRYSSNESFSLAYQNYEGDGLEQSSPILVIHGLFGSKRNWHTFCKSCSELTGRQIISVDCRNHGQSPRSDYMTYPLLAGDIAETLRKLSIPKSILIGHSMGGKVAMEAALSMPSIVEKLILVDKTPMHVSTEDTISMVPMVLSALRNLDLTQVKSRRDADKMLRKSIPIDGLRAWALTNLYKDKERKYHLLVNVDSIQKNIETLLGPVELNKREPFTEETLFIGGANSSVLRNVDMNEIRKMFPKAELEMVPGAGHFVHSDKPKEFLETVCDFL